MSEPTLMQIVEYLEDGALSYRENDKRQQALITYATFLRDVAHDISVLEQAIYYEDRIDIVNRRVMELAEKINGK